MCRTPCFPPHPKVLSNLLIFENLVGGKDNSYLVSRTFLVQSQSEQLSIYFRHICIFWSVYWLFQEPKASTLTHSLDMRGELPPPMPANTACSLHCNSPLTWLYYSFIFPSIALLFQDAFTQANIHYYSLFIIETFQKTHQQFKP